MSATDPFDRIGAYYDQLVRRHGHHPAACDYGSPESQITKFDALCGVMPLDGLRVLDVGCGFADFANFIDERFENVGYTGVDISVSMIEAARKLHPHKNIHRMNVLRETPGKFDVVSANGIFYLLGQDATQLMHALILKMYQAAERAVAFNSLSTWCTDPEEGEYYADPLETIDYCRSISPWVVLRHDYHPRDFTVYLYRKRPR